MLLTKNKRLVVQLTMVLALLLAVMLPVSAAMPSTITYDDFISKTGLVPTAGVQVDIENPQGSMGIGQAENENLITLWTDYQFASTITIKVSNTSGAEKVLSFDYAYTGDLSNITVSVDGASNSATSGSVSKALLSNGSTVQITLTMKAELDGEATMTLSNFALADKVSIKAGVAITGSGTVTVDGTPVVNGGSAEVTADSTFVAAPASGYTFMGWVDSSNKLLSREATYKPGFTANASIHAIFANSSIACFRVGTEYLYTDLAAALTKAASHTTKIVVCANDATLSGSYTIPSGVTLLVPYNDADTCLTDANDSVNIHYVTGTKWEQPTAYRTLTLAEKATLTVESGGTISVSGRMNSAMGSNGSPHGPTGVIKMSKNSKITVKSGGKLYAWGFITGVDQAAVTGATPANVIVKSGGYVYERFQIIDWRGGAAAISMIFDRNGGFLGANKAIWWAMGKKGYVDSSSEVNPGVFPITQYYVQNIEVPLTLEAGATELGSTAIEVSGAGVQNQTVAFICSNGMFRLASGTITKRYDGSTDRLIIDVNGALNVDEIVLDLPNVQLAGIDLINIDIYSSKYTMPIGSNMTINIRPNSTLNANQNMSLLPGSQINIASEGTLVLAKNKKMYVYDHDEWFNGNYVYISSGVGKFKAVPYAPSRTYTRSEADLVDAAICVNGTLNASSGVLYTSAGGANIYSTSNGTGKVMLSKASNVTLPETVQSNIKVTFAYNNFTGAKVRNETTAIANSSNYNSAATYFYAHQDCLCGDTATHGQWATAAHNITRTTVNATCTTDGIITDTCSCGQVCTQVIPATGHSSIYSAEVTNPTCEADGYTTYTCQNGCGDSYQADYTDAIGHSYTNYVSNNDATCEADGTVTATCDHGCGGTDTKSVTDSKVNHDYNVVITAPTCIEDGYTTYTCKYGCGDSYTGDTVPSLGHKFEGEWVKTETGHARACKACGTPDTEVAHNAGTPVNENVVDSSCYAEGSYNEVVYCNECNYKISSTPKNIEKKDHTPGAPVREDVVDAKCNADGSYEEVVYCSVENCKAEISRETKTTEATGVHDYSGDWDYTETGHAKKCVNGCDQPGTYADHTFDSACDTDCNDGCGYTRKPSHTFDKQIVKDEYKATDATCTAKATYYYSCACGAKGTTTFETGEPLGHEDKDFNHICDRNCGKKDMGVHDDGDDNNHFCDYGCGQVADDGCHDVATDGDHKCDECEAANVTICVDSGKDHVCDTDSACAAYNSGSNAHADADKNHECDYGCTVEIGKDQHMDSADDDDHFCDYGCKQVLEACSDADNDGDHKCDICEKESVTACADSGKDHACDTDSACTAYSTGEKEHKAAANSHNCAYCGEAASECKDNLEAQDGNAATCTEDGFNAYWTCSVCSANYADDQAATKIENLEAWKSGDGKINKINHNMVVSQVVAPTCISDGYTVYACSYGCETTENREKVEALGHSWVDADCDTPKTCSVCNATEGDALGHTPGAEADCVNAQTCTVCGTVLNAAQGHTWTDATCTAAKTCSVCGATEGEALAHNYENNNGFCKVCGNYEPAALNGDVYEISNAGQLYWFAQKVNGGDTKIKGALTANIDLNPGYAFHTDGTVTYNGETVTEGWRSWTPIGTGKAYAGIFDGRNYTVMGARATGVRSAGLFGSLDTAQIKNLSVDNSYFVGDHHAGGIVGGADYGHILNCHNNATVISGANTTGSSGAGGIIGFNGAAESGTGSIIGCSNTGYVTSLSGLAYVGGILGHGQELTISNCYNHGAVVGGQVRAGIAANLDYGGDYVSNCYNTSDVSNPYSGIAGGIYKTSFSNCYYLADSETDNFAGTTAMTAEQFASGEVAYLLNGGDAQSQKVWFQTCGEGYPAFSGETVYKHRSGGCTAGSYVYGYSNEDLADITTHNVTKVDAVAATCTEEGNVLHYHCADCEKNYSDEEATDELSVVVTNKLNHTYETYVNNGETHSLTCNACGVVDPNCNGADHYFDVNDDHKCACGKIGSITVIWLNEDGSELKKIEVTFGTKYEDRAPEAPTKAATAEYTYTFSSWKYVEDEDTGNVTATPLFNYMANSYTVKWMDGDTVVKEETLDYGAEITKHAELTKEGYTFNGWEGFSKDMTMPAKDVTFTAKWLVNSYTITWMNGEEVFATTEVNFGEQITAPEGTPKKAKSEACEVFTFSGWCVIPETMPADENLVIYAQYDSKVIHQWQEQIVYSWEGSVCTATHVCLNNQAHNETARPDETKQVVDKVATCTETGTYHYEAIFNDGWAKGTSVGETSYTLAKDPNAHTIVYVAKVSATCVEAGVKEHWKCSACNALFEDEAGTTATTAEALVIAKSEEHTWKDACDSDCEIEGCTATREAPHDLEGVEWQNTETEHWKVCKLCSAEVNKVAHTVQNGKCTACDKVFGVAQIGDQVYATLKEALDAAKALENPTITLLADVEGKVTIAQVVTIDKNGFAAEIVAGDTYTLVDAEDDAVVKVVKVSNVTIKYKGANTLFEDILYGIAVYDIKGAENIDLMTDAGIMYWYEDEYTPVNLATLEFDPDHAATGLQPYPGTAFYYGQTDGIFTKNLHKDIYIIAYVKLENGDYVFANKVIKYSVVEYAATMYERTESETFKNLYAQLLNYISGAQGYFEKGTPASELANYVLPEELREYTYDSTSLTLAPYVPSDKQVTRNKSVFKGRGKNLLFEEQISMVTLYAIPESYTNTAKEMGVIFWTKDQFDKLSGKPGIDNYGDGVRITQMMYSETDQAWFASAPPVVAKMMHATQYYILGYLVDENGAIHYSGVEGYSVEAYIEQAVRTGSNEMAAFAKRLYAYERAAEAAIS